MTTTDSINKFSVARALKFARCFNPTLKLQLMICPAASLFCAIVTVLLEKYPLGIPFVALLSLIVTALLYLSSLVFTSGSDLVVETELPIRGDEKALFMIVYTLIVIPVIMWIPEWAVNLITVHFFPSLVEGNTLLEAKTQMPDYALTNIFQSLAPASVCLLAVVTYKTRRILMPVIWTVVTLIGIGIVSGITVIIKLIASGVFSRIDATDAIDQEQLKLDIIDTISPEIITLGIIMALVTIICAYLTYRRVSRRQI